MYRQWRTDRVGAGDGVGLLAEAEVLLAGEHLVNEFPVEDCHLGPERLQLLQQQRRALLDLAPRQVRRALGGARNHVREPDAEVQELQCTIISLIIHGHD